MTTFLVIDINPLPGLDAEFNEWYDNIHLGEVVQIGGALNGQRFRLADTQVNPAQSHRYQTLYELDSSNTEAALKNMLEALPHMQIKPVSDSQGTRMAVFESVTELVHSRSNTHTGKGANHPSAWLLVRTTPNSGMEAEFNEWYDNVHIPELMDLAGFYSAQRFKLADTQVHDGAQPYQYLARYEIDSNDVAGVLRRLQEALPKMRLKPVASSAQTNMAVYQSITDRIQ